MRIVMNPQVSQRQVIVSPDLEDGGWVGEVPSLPGCVSQGETHEELIENIREAIATWIEGAEAIGLPIPKESFDVQVFVV